MTTKIYHNPRCSKSSQAIELLRESGDDFDIVEYLKAPPSSDELGALLKMLGLSPRELMRTHEAPYRELGLGSPDLSDETLIAAMIDNPILIERPIVVVNGKAVIGRPPSAVLDIL